MPRHESLAPFTAAVMLLTKAPRTVAELAGLLGTARCTTLGWLRRLEAEGLVQRNPTPRKNQKGRGSPEWTWIA